MRRPCSLVLAIVIGLTTTLGAQTTPPVSASSGVLRVYIARHGETPANAERRVVGQLDEPLSARGREQAIELREALRGVRFEAIYASPLSRSLETAAAIAEGRPVRVLSGLRERNQGRFQGLLADSLPDFTRRMANPNDGLDGGETTMQLDGRVRAALDVVRRGNHTGNILIVGHFLTNQMLLKELMSLTVADAMRINQANDELYVVELRNGVAPSAWKLIDRTHLGDL